MMLHSPVMLFLKLTLLSLSPMDMTTPWTMMAKTTFFAVLFDLVAVTWLMVSGHTHVCGSWFHHSGPGLLFMLGLFLFWLKWQM